MLEVDFMSHYDDFDFTDIVNANSDRVHHEEFEKSKQEARERSVGYERKRYQDKKKKSKENVRQAIIVMTLIASLAVGARVNSVVTDYKNIVISRTSETKHEVDEKIQYYFEIMGVGGTDSRRIETSYLPNVNAKEFYVDYSPFNLANNIVEASKISEVEVRCVVIAAFKLINEPYRDQVFSDTLRIIATSPELMDAIPASMSYLKTGNVADFLAGLGYTDWHEYQMNERKNIKDLNAIEAYVDNGMRR